MLDYAANAQIYWPEERIRAIAAEGLGGVDALNAKLREFLNQGDSELAEVDTEAYWQLVERNLRNGEVRLLFVADVIPTELRRVIEFLNEHMPLVEVLGVEIRHYEGKGIRALVPRVVGQTESARQQKPSPPRNPGKITKEEFLNACPGDSKTFFLQLLDAAEQLGYEIVWRPTGFTARLRMPNGSPASLFLGDAPMERGPAAPLLQVYLGAVKQVSDALRQDLLTKAAFIEKGKYTLEIVLHDESARALLPVTQELLRVAKAHTSRMEQPIDGLPERSL